MAGSSKSSSSKSSEDLRDKLKKLQSEHMIYHSTYGNKFYEPGDQEEFEKKDKAYRDNIKKLENKLNESKTAEKLKKLESEYIIYDSTYGNKFYSYEDQEEFEKKSKDYQSRIKKLRDQLKK